MKAVCIKQLGNCADILCVYEFNDVTITSWYPDGTPYQVYKIKLKCVERKEISAHNLNAEEFDEYFKRIEE